MACNGAKKEMKKLLLVLLFVPIICSAQILEKSASGKYRISTGKNEKWESLNITVKPEAQKYNCCFAKAISSPNKKILVEKSEDFLKLKLLFKEKVEVKENFIVYNSKTKTINYLEFVTEKEESSYLILFSIASIILMIISNILFKRGDFKYVDLFLEIFTGVAFIALMFSTYVIDNIDMVNPGLIGLSSVAAGYALIASVVYIFYNKGRRVRAIILSAIFYILMATHIVLMFV